MKHSTLRIAVFSFLIALLPFHTALAITSRDVLRSVLENDPAAKYLNIANLPGMSVPYHITQQQNSPPITNNFSTRYTFTDQEKDDESGLLYFGARYYDPVIGRFTQPDPSIIDPTRPEFREAMFNPQLLNTYSYVVNNPVKMVDKEGESPVLFFLLGAAEMLTAMGIVSLPMIPAIFENPGLAGQMTIRTAPFYGDAIDITEAVTGRDVFIGQQFGGLERGATIMGAAIPIIPNQVARGITKTEAVQGVVRMFNDIKINKILRQVEAGSGNFTIKVGNKGDVFEAGLRHVGPDYKNIMDRQGQNVIGIRSMDGMRQFRYPTSKGYGGEVGNLEVFDKERRE